MIVFNIKWEQVNVPEWKVEMAGALLKVDNILSSNLDVHFKAVELSEIIYNATSKHIVRPEHLNDYTPTVWMCKECITLRKYVHESCEMLGKDGYKTCGVREELSRRRSIYCKHSDVCKKEYTEGTTSKLLSLQKNDICRYWQLLKGVAQLRYPDISTDNFHNHFYKLHCPDQMDLYRPSDDVRDLLRDYVQCDSIYEELDIPITLLEITKAIATLKNNKSPGPDGAI